MSRRPRPSVIAAKIERMKLPIEMVICSSKIMVNPAMIKPPTTTMVSVCRAARAKTASIGDTIG